MGERQAELDHRTSRDDEQLYESHLELMNQAGAVAALGRRQAELWVQIVFNVPDGAQALLISHGGLIEPGLVAALPTWLHAEWDRGLKHGEGARLRHDGSGFIDAEILHATTSQ